MPADDCCSRCKAIFTSEAWDQILHPSSPADGSSQKLSFNYGNVASFRPSNGCKCCQSLAAAISFSQIDPHTPLSGDIVLETSHDWKAHAGTDLDRHSGECTSFGIRFGSLSSRIVDLAPSFDECESLRPYWAGPWMQPIEPCEVPVGLIRSWISRCEKHHVYSCRPVMVEQARSVSTMFIDVFDDCLVERKLLETNYLALSYVWGPVANLQTTRSDLDVFKKPGGLTKARKQLGRKYIPETIKSAIQLTRDLGFQYLWVDSLCIVHDNHDMLQQHLDNMGFIYANASLTLVATYGRNADAGLRKPAVLPMSEVDKLPAIQFPHIRLRLARSRFLDGIDISRSQWGKRAWTFQEAFLSRRCVIFGEQTMWYCRAECGRESQVDLSPRAESFASNDLSPWGARDLSYICFDISNISANSPLLKWQVLDHIITIYSGRNLSIDTDITRAIAGTLSLFTKLTGTKFHYGLPIEIFGVAMLWGTRATGSMRRGTASGLTSPENLPSWSWMGWQTFANVSIWSVLKPQSRQHEDLVTWHNDLGCFKHHLLNLGSAQAIPHNCICHQSTWTQSLSVPSPLLYFSCDSAFLNYQALEQSHRKDVVRVFPSDSGPPIGFIHFVESEKSNILMEMKEGSSWPKLELLCLSRGHFTRHDIGSSIGANKVVMDPFLESYHEQFFDRGYRFCNVLAIKRQEGIALRIGTGRVLESAWDLVTKKRIDVVLG